MEPAVLPRYQIHIHLQEAKKLGDFSVHSHVKYREFSIH